MHSVQTPANGLRGDTRGTQLRGHLVDCTLFKKGLPDGGHRLRIAPFYFVFEAFTRKNKPFYTFLCEVLYYAKLEIVARIG